MSTRITVATSGGTLLGRIKTVQTANREALVQKEQDAATEDKVSVALTAAAQASERPAGGTPDTSVSRRVSAQRKGTPLIPFAMSWRGTLTTRTPTVYQVQLRTLPNVTVPPSIFTYSGGDYLEAGAFQIASSKSTTNIEQPARYSEWNTKAKIAYLGFYGYEWTYEGFWAELLKSNASGTQTWQLPTAPGNLSPVGPFFHSTSPSYLAVATDGTVFITVALPKNAIDTNSVQTPSETPITTFDRDVYYSTSNEPFKLDGLQQYVTIGGTPYYNGLPVGSPNPYPSTPLYSFQGQPYLFMKVSKGVITTKTATRAANAAWNTFYAENAWTDDPGKELRGSYSGEVRIRSGKAHFLRLRYEEVIDNDLYVNYENFPFPSLGSFVSGSGASTRLQAGVKFEDHIYNLNPYNTSAELAAQLSAITLPTGFNGQTTDPPDQVVAVQTKSDFLAAAAKSISTSGSEVLTPLTFFVALP